MRIFLLENFINTEFDVSTDEGREAVIAYARKNCSKALREFYQHGHYLYRGEKNVDNSRAYVINTREKRQSLGSNLAGRVKESFNQWLEDNGHVRRDRYVTFVSTAHPSKYNGVQRDAWFYCLPIGDFRYSYINLPDVKDFNLQPLVTKTFRSLKKIEENVDKIYVAANISQNLIKKAKDKSDVNFDEVVYLKKFETMFYALNAKASQITLEIQKVLDKGLFQNNLDRFFDILADFKILTDAYSKFYSRLKNTHKSIDVNSEEYKAITESEIFSTFILLWDTLQPLSRIDSKKLQEDLNTLLNTFISDKLTPHIKNNEVSIQCSRYLMIPLDGGEDFIKTLLGGG